MFTGRGQGRFAFELERKQLDRITRPVDGSNIIYFATQSKLPLSARNSKQPSILTYISFRHCITKSQTIP